MNAPGFFPLFGLLFIGFAVFGVISSMTKVQGLRSREADFQARRAQLIAGIEQAKRP